MLQYPKGERVWVEYYNQKKELRYIVTAKQTREYFYVYELVNGAFVKLGRDKNPLALEEKYIKI